MLIKNRDIWKGSVIQIHVNRIRVTQGVPVQGWRKDIENIEGEGGLVTIRALISHGHQPCLIDCRSTTDFLNFKDIHSFAGVNICLYFLGHPRERFWKFCIIGKGFLAKQSGFQKLFLKLEEILVVEFIFSDSFFDKVEKIFNEISTVKNEKEM